MEKGRQQKRSCTSSGREGNKTAAEKKKREIWEKVTDISKRIFRKLPVSFLSHLAQGAIL